MLTAKDLAYADPGHLKDLAYADPGHLTDTDPDPDFSPPTARVRRELLRVT